MTTDRANKCGAVLYCVEMADGRNVHVRADTADCKEDGSLAFMGRRGDTPTMNLAFARGQWIVCYRADREGAALAIEEREWNRY